MVNHHTRYHVDTFITYSFHCFFVSDTEMSCRHCSLKLPNSVETIINHCKLCKSMPRKNRTFNYSCIFCAYHTYHKFGMRAHMKDHMGEKPYMCSFCSFSCGTLPMVRAHIREKHNIELVEGWVLGEGIKIYKWSG